MERMNASDQAWVQEMVALSNRITQKLQSMSVLSPESNGNIAHHLAEVCLSAGRLKDEIVPSLLATPVSDNEKLAELSHDLMSELQEIRDNIEAIDSDLTALMNALNK